MRKYLIWAAALLLVAPPAFAQQPGAAAMPIAPVAAPAKPKKICRKREITGRRISQTDCYTAAQWAEYDRTQEAAAAKLVGDVSGFGARSTLSSSSDGSLSSGSVFGLGPR